MTRTILATTTAGPDHQVVSFSGGGSAYRRKPCDGCPWILDNVGRFPPEAFIASAEVAYDMSTHVFSCHESGMEHSAICAGFLLQTVHNLALRLKLSNGAIDMTQVSDGGCHLFYTYREMALANGVASDDPALVQCR